MIPLEEIKKYLPSYLSPESQKELFKELTNFPQNIDQRIYTTQLSALSKIFQGDGLRNLLYIHFPSIEIKKVPGMVLSNSCDIDISNRRFSPIRMVYSPIINLSKYKNSLVIELVESGKRTIQEIDSHISDIQKQYISHIFFLPKGGGLEDDSFVFFDRLNNCPSNYVDENDLKDQKIFTLSDYGFYLFLFKLSVHFTRMREGLIRSINGPLLC